MSIEKQEGITIVIPSLETIGNKKDLIEHVVKTALPMNVIIPISINFIEKNTKSLTEVYQEELDNSENDIIIFMHDDIEFLKPGWAKEVFDIFKRNPQYGIIGVAGTRVYGENDKIAWWDSEMKDKRGFLFHGDKEKSWVTIFSDFNDKVDLMEVAVIDGLFMAVNRKKIEYDFDTDIKGFHFYDIDFCVANFLSHNCRIGVTNKVAIRHKSTGSTDEKWLNNGRYVFEKYKNNFPIKVFRK